MIQGTAILHAVDQLRGLFDLAELDAVTEVLDLAVHTSVEHQVAVFAPAAEVAGLVDQLAVVRVQRILDKGRVGDFLVAVVAERQDRTADADLTDLAVGREGVVLIQQRDLIVIIRLADGQDGIVVHLVLHHIIGAGGGRLGRTVLVDVQYVGQVLLPDLQILAGHDRTGEAELLQILGLALIESAQLRGDLYARNAPAQRGDLLTVESTEELRRNGEFVLRDDEGGSALADREVDVADSRDIVERALVAHRIGIVDVEHLADAVDIGHQREVRGDNALGLAGGTGGKDHIQRRGADQSRGALCEQLIIRGRIHDLFHHDDIAVIIEGFRRLEVRLVYQKIRRFDDGEDLVESRLGHIAVHGRVEAARSDGAEEARRGIDMSAGHDRYRIAGGGKTCKVGSDRSRELVKLTEGQAALGILEHHLVRVGGGYIIQSFENRCLHIQHVLSVCCA